MCFYQISIHPIDLGANRFKNIIEVKFDELQLKN